MDGSLVIRNMDIMRHALIKMSCMLAVGNLGMRPAMDNLGMRPAMDNLGMRPAMDNLGMRPAMDNLGMRLECG